MIYIASPYSHPDKAVMQTRYEQVKSVAAEMMREGLPIYSPIVHGHDIAVSHDLPTDWEFWKKQCLAMLRKADSMTVITLPGWIESKGVLCEIEFCNNCGIPINYRATEVNHDR